MKSWGLPVLLPLLLAAALLLAGCTLAPVTELPPASADSPLAPVAATPQTEATPVVSNDDADDCA